MIISITNNKGGCGKTVTAINTGAALRLSGYDVLLIDFDGQANLTTALRCNVSHGSTYDLMRGQGVTPVRVSEAEQGAGVLDVLPSCRDLSALELELSTRADRVTRLGSLLESLRGRYDYIVIDTPPSLGLLTVNALYACDAAVVPVEPEYFAVQGLLAINETIQTVAGYRNKVLPTKVLFTRYDRRKTLHRTIIEQVEAAKIGTFDTRIRSNVSVGEAPACGVDVFRYAPKSYGAVDYRAFGAEVAKWTKVKHKRHQQ